MTETRAHYSAQAIEREETEMIVFTLFLPKPPEDAVKILRALFTMVLGWLAHTNVIAYLTEKPAEVADED